MVQIWCKVWRVWNKHASASIVSPDTSTVNAMPVVNQQPDPNRRQTRATNANVHPGNIVKEVLGGRRKQEDIDSDKKSKTERRKARERKKNKEREAIKKIADFENKMALHDQSQETLFPRRQTEGRWSAFSLLSTHVTVTLPLVNAPSGNQQGKNKKRKSEAEQRTGNHGAVSHNMKKSLDAHPNPELQLDNGNVDAPDLENSQPTKAKKQKLSSSYVAAPLRQTG